jgi:hypothetical protein
MRVLLGDQELGVIALGVQRIGGDHRPGQVHRLQQRRETGDLVGLAVLFGLGEHGAGLLVCCRQQVPGLPVSTGMPGATHRLTVHGHRPPLPRPGPAGRAACSRAASQDPTAASTASSTRRIVASSGGRNTCASGS